MSDELASLVTPEEHDEGFKIVPLAYHRGPPKEGWPGSVKLSAPSRREAARIAIEVQAELAKNGDAKTDAFWPAISACLPPEHRTPEFLERLDLHSYGLISATSLVLCFGADAQKKNCGDALPGARIQDGCDWLRAELAIVRAGLADRAEVKRWSIPKIKLWLALLQETECRGALLQSAAVWEPGKVEDAMQKSRENLHELARLATPAAPEMTVTDRIWARIKRYG